MSEIKTIKNKNKDASAMKILLSSTSTYTIKTPILSRIKRISAKIKDSIKANPK